ncbi:hypothetical protein BvCms1485_03304 [Escherichia coli]|nr:hypothetical protein BvCms1485_03304 [Escherichia coli]
MKGRQSRYVTGGESFAEIARRPGGTVVMLCLNPGLEEALREASKSLKSAFSRNGGRAVCRSQAGNRHASVCGGALRGAGGKNLKNAFAWLPLPGTK